MFKRYFIACFFLFNSTLAHCNDGVDIDQSELLERTIMKLLDNHEGLVAGMSDDRIYLRPEVIYPTDHGLVVYSTKKEEIILPMLFSDSRGCFIAHDQPTYWCAVCRGYRYAYPNGRCKRCGNNIAPAR